MSQYELSKLTKAELTEIYRGLRNAAKRRMRTFEKHKETIGIPKRVRELKAPSKLNKKELIKSIGTAGNWYLSERGTYTGYKRERRKLKAKFEKRLGSTLSDKEFDDVGRFIGDMRDRAGDMFKDASKKAIVLYGAAKDKGMDPDQFLRNWDYWTKDEHLKAFQDTDIIKKEGKVYPSDYIRALGLPTIKSYEKNKYNED